MLDKIKDAAGLNKALNGGSNGGLDGALESIKAKKSQGMIFWVGLGVALVILMLLMKSKSPTGNASKDLDALIKLEVASSSLDSEKMWRNHFEEKLLETKSKTDEKLKLIEEGITEQSISIHNQLKTELEELKSKIAYLSEEQNLTKRELGDAQRKLDAEGEDKASSGDVLQASSSLTVNSMGRSEAFDRPKSSRNFIPETAYVKGVLLGGIVVSTAIGSSSEPVPVIIRITDRGNLPKNFSVDLTHCKIMGSSYGDLSSERAVVRAEVLSCHDPKNELIYTTKVAGLIFGDDGMNGIKGKVVQTSDKHMKNAIVGSMLSGFASSMKGQEQLMISSMGAVSTKRQGVGEALKEGALAGSSNAAEKIADYYIKRAEGMSPVLLVSGGVKVDIVFTKGVYLNSKDVAERLERERAERVK
jgi:conjugal transfer pilus assembly protein TraB